MVFIGGKNMEDYIEIEGLLNEVLDELSNMYSLTRKQIRECIDFILDNKEILSKEELIQCSSQCGSIEGISQFIADESRYYISIKKSTMYLVLWLMGKLTDKNFFTAASALGCFKGGAVIKRIKEEYGEKCILMEMVRNRKKGADIYILDKYHGECCNNHYNCRYNKNGLCVCSIESVVEICQKFVEEGILIKRGQKYIYQM